MNCPACHHEVTENSANFCGHCGASLFPEQVHIEAGRYRFTFSPLEIECPNLFQAKRLIQEFKFRGKPVLNIEVYRIAPATSRLTHPFICFNCRQIVSKIDQGKCRHCGYRHWVPRDNETEKPSALLIPRAK